jgi:hypothetical protein
MAVSNQLMSNYSKSALEKVMAMEEFRLVTPRNELVIENVKQLLRASGELLDSVEKVMFAMKQEVSPQLVLILCSSTSTVKTAVHN